MSSQTVYFTNPAQITAQSNNISQIQNVSCLATQMNAPLTMQGLSAFTIGGSTGFPATGSPAVTVANSFMKCTAGQGSGQDASGTNSYGCAIVVGNAFSGQEVMYSTGPCTSAGAQWNYTGTLMPIFSASKFFNSFIWLKMLDERLIALADPVSKYLPDWVGTYYYYTGASGNFFTGAQINAATPDFSSWTGARLTGDLGTELTLAHLISENFAFPHQVSFSPSQVQVWTTAPPATAGGVAALPYVNWNFLNTIKDGYLAHQAAVTAGSASGALAAGNAWWHFESARLANNFSYMTGPVTDSLATALKCIKSGAIPLAWKIGSTALSPYTNTIVQNGNYGLINYELLSACCSVAVKTAGYASIFDYFNIKILQPLEISTQDLFLYNYNNVPSGITLAEPACRRTLQMATGTWTGQGADPQYYADCLAGLRPFNSLYWQSQYPNDKYANYPTTAYFDPNGWDFGQSITCNFRAWSKVMKCFINNGTYLNSQGQWVRVMSAKIMKFASNSVIAPGALWYQYQGTPSNTTPNGCWTVAQCIKFVMNGEFSDITNNLDAWPGASTTRNTLPATTDSLYYWAGLFGTAFLIDKTSGYYVLGCNCIDGFLNVAKPMNSSANTIPIMNFIAEN